MSAFLELMQGSVPPKVIKSPFSYPGGKRHLSKDLSRIMPSNTTFVDVFGGSGTVLLNMKQSKIEVFNDINSGVVSVFRCLRDPAKFSKLTEWIASTIHSREDWMYCKETWQDCEDVVERAGRWLVMLDYSFGVMGRNYGYAKSNGNMSGRLARRIPSWYEVSRRLSSVNIENLHFANIFEKYDSPNTTFYCDPPYVGADNRAAYSLDWTRSDVEELLQLIRDAEGSVVLSGYENTLISDRPFWNKTHFFESQTVMGKTEHRHVAKEVAWLKY